MSKKTKQPKDPHYVIRCASNGVFLIPVKAMKKRERQLKKGIRVQSEVAFRHKHGIFIPNTTENKPAQKQATKKSYIYGSKTCPKTGRIIATREPVQPTNPLHEWSDTATSLSCPLSINLQLTVEPTGTDPNTCNLYQLLHQLLTKLAQ